MSTEQQWQIAKHAVQAGPVSLRTARKILEKSTVDEQLIQRIFAPWNQTRKVGYIKSLLNGTNLTSVFVLANISSILKSIQFDIDNVNLLIEEGSIDKDSAGKKLETLAENKEYFQNLLDRGFDYLLIDGKHRHELLNETFGYMDLTTGEQVHPQFKFTDEFKNMISKDGIPVDVAGRTLGEFNDLSEYLLDECEVLVCVINNGDIQSMQAVFVGANSGLQLFPMELRICTMSILARFVRGLTDRQENPTIHSFVNALSCLGGDSTKSLIKKGDLLLISLFIAYYMNNIKDNPNPSKTFFSEKYLDKMYDYDYEFSNNDREFIRSVTNVVAQGSLDQYSKKKNNNKSTPKYIGYKWSDVMNLLVFTAVLMKGNAPVLRKMRKRITVKNKSLFIREMFIVLTKLAEKDKYELDRNGKPLQKRDPYGNPATTPTGKPIYIENEHSFARKNRNNNEDNQRIKAGMFMEFVRDNDLLTKWKNMDIIELVSHDRGLTPDEKRIQAFVNQGGLDIFTNKPLDLGEVDSGLTVAAHIIPHSQGGEKMVVGDAVTNLNAGAVPIYDQL